MKSTVINLINLGNRYLKRSGVLTPRLSSERLLEYVLKESTGVYASKNTFAYGIAGLYLDRSLIVEHEPRRRFFTFLRERAKRFPLQYLIGDASFMDFSLLVDRSCLIPRPETELLVENILEEIRKRVPSGEVRIIDIGTGCGNIALSLARYLPFSEVWATDISEEALSTARKNAERLEVRMGSRFIRSDLFENVPDIRFECVVSNPPYLSSKDLEGLEGETLFEPRKALFGGNRGTEFALRLARDARRFLTRGGLLALEIGMGQAEEVGALLRRLGYSEVRIVSDYAGIQRIVLARRKER